VTDCHHNRLRKSTKKKETFNLKDFGKFHRKEQKKKRARAHAKPNQQWQRERVLMVLRVALAATHNNPEGEQRNVQPILRRCIAILEGKELPTNEVAFMLKGEEEDFSNFTKDTWYADSAASTHMGNTDVGMFDYEDINERVTVGNGKTIWAKKRGKIRLTVIQLDGATAEVMLHNYQFVPDMDGKLFAIIKSMEQGFSISNEGPSLIISRGKLRITFDRIMYTRGGRLCGVVWRW
jgi:hypothetical protein